MVTSDRGEGTSNQNNSDRETGDTDDRADGDPNLLTQQWQRGLDTNRVDGVRYVVATGDSAVFVGSRVSPHSSARTGPGAGVARGSSVTVTARL